MQSKLFKTVGALILGVGILAAATQGCGGSSSTPSDGGAGTNGGAGTSGGATLADVIATCNQICDKEATCPPVVLSASDCKSTICSKIGSTGGAGTTGSTGSADNCGGITYAQFQAKMKTASRCRAPRSSRAS